MQRTQTRVTSPAGFNFSYTVNSHGWERLEPFSLSRPLEVSRCADEKGELSF